MVRKLIVFFTFIGIALMIVTIYFKQEVTQNKIKAIKDQLSVVLEHQLKVHKVEDLKEALLLAKNTALLDALENDDEDLGYTILNDIVTTLEQYTRKRIRAQVITKDFDIFARSWDNVYAGMPIGDYRHDFAYFFKHKHPRSSVEIGRRLGIKATVPVYIDDTLIGFVEVISFFKSMTDFFRSIGVDFYALLNVEYIDTAVLMMNNLSVQHYVIANRNYNFAHIQTLQKVDFKTLSLNKVTFRDGKYIFYKKMVDGEGKKIGAYIMVLPQKYFEYFRDSEDEISFLINVTRSDLYSIVKEKEEKVLTFDSYSADAMVYLQDVIDKEDRQVFLDEAYEKFDQYTKDELIQMILNRKIIKKIDGKIK